MKTKWNPILALSVAAVLGLAACSDDGDVADKDEGAGDGGYPLKVCVVSGEELGSMGKPVEYDHEGTTVKFCCKSCIPKFEEDPATYLAKLKGGGE